MLIVVRLSAGHHLQEDQCECPHFRILSTGDPLPEIELFSLGITSILVDASDNKSDFLRVKKRWPLFLLLKLVRERHEIDVANDCNDTSKLEWSVNPWTLEKSDELTTPSMMKI